MADTVFQCIELFTVTGYDLPLTKITDEEVVNTCLTLCLVTYLPAIGIMIIREVILKIIHMML